MKSALEQLFAHASTFVTRKDFEFFAPNYPYDAVSSLAEIHESARLPDEEAYQRLWSELTETIHLHLFTRIRTPLSESDERRFRRYRSFITTIGVGIFPWANGAEFLVLHQLLVTLLRDAECLQDPVLNRHLQTMVLELPSVLRALPEKLRMAEPFEEWAFVTLTLLILDNFPGTERQNLLPLVHRFREEEKAGHQGFPASELFLWGLTHYDTLFPIWLELIQSHLTSMNDFAVRALAEELLAASRDMLASPLS